MEITEIMDNLYVQRVKKNSTSYWLIAKHIITGKATIKHLKYVRKDHSVTIIGNTILSGGPNDESAEECLSTKNGLKHVFNDLFITPDGLIVDITEGNVQSAAKLKHVLQWHIDSLSVEFDDLDS